MALPQLSPPPPSDPIGAQVAPELPDAPSRMLLPPPLPRFAGRNRNESPSGRVRAMTPAKRVLDLVVSAVMLLLLSPLILLIAVAIRLDSRGPVFFVQERVGHRGVRFPMLKFRSMYTGAEANHGATRSDRSGICFKAIDDPRITRMGRLLRRTSLDELPQLINVLRGQMSLVGPRPALAHEVAAYPDIALERLNSVPGLTGLWQVSGRADLDFDTMVQLDLLYQARHSVWLDLALLWRTIGAVVTARGAY